MFDRVADPNELKNILHSAPADLIEQLKKENERIRLVLARTPEPGANSTFQCRK